MGHKRIVFLLILLLLVYLSLYTWNLRSGVIDRLAGYTGLEAVGAILTPGRFVHTQAVTLWHRYIHLVEVETENEELKGRLDLLSLENGQLRELAGQALRLQALLAFPGEPRWRMSGARVVAHEIGPSGALDSILIDKGAQVGAKLDAPVISPTGAVGRILRVSPHWSTVLLLTDPNSRLAVMGRDSRTTGILSGQGPREPLSVLYVPVNAPIEPGEVLITSGMAGLFPKGIPVARVTKVERSDISLFKNVLAEPLVDFRTVEEVLVLGYEPPPPPPPAPPEAKPASAEPTKSAKAAEAPAKSKDKAPPKDRKPGAPETKPPAPERRQ